MMKDLTEGNPQNLLWRFTIPMFISVIFQQMYNIADSVIAGKFAGEDALAAVGASYPITMIFMAIAVGSNIGCSVVISQFFGAKRYDQMKTSVYTTLISATVLSILLTIAGLLGSRGLLEMIRTPENIFASGDLYLRIYIGGFLFLYLYNVATGIFTSLGDSKTPLYFLIGSSIGNVVLDYWFVAKLGFGVAGVAWATFIAQGIACVLALITMAFRLRTVKTEQPPVLFSMDMLKHISMIAVPSILQQSFISIGNIFVQGLINSFGSSVIAGYSAAVKLNTFTLTSFTTLGNGISSFTAQNLGAGKVNRIKEGMKGGVKLGLLLAVPFLIAFFGFGDGCMSLFMKEDSVVATQTGVQFLRIVSPFYLVVAMKLVSDGVLRGSGSMKEFMTATFSDLILRVLLSFVLAGLWGPTGVWLSWPVGWIVGAVLSLYFNRRVMKKMEIMMADRA
ncbi:MAG: MATE family efflux transporter [Lachnospiraceae bacterium]|nr:MATE family efflux transporter [Lachnospiraceae bacterium]